LIIRENGNSITLQGHKLLFLFDTFNVGCYLSVYYAAQSRVNSCTLLCPWLRRYLNRLYAVEGIIASIMTIYRLRRFTNLKTYQITFLKAWVLTIKDIYITTC